MKTSKRVLVAVVAVIMIATLVCALTACDTGKYVNGDSYVKLKIGGKFVAHLETTVLGAKVTKDIEGTYEIGDKDDNGNKPVVFTVTSDDKSSASSFTGAYIDSEGDLYLAGLWKFTK